MKTLDAKTRVQFKNILFATDFSPTAAAALPFAAQLAKHFGANLFAFHVRTPIISPITSPVAWPALEKAVEEQERERTESLRNAVPGIETTVLIEEGDIWTNLQAVILKRNIDLLVIGTHGRSGMGKLVLGSAAEQIFRDAHCPVLTVGPHSLERSSPDGEFHRILCASSFESESTTAAAYAVSFAQECESSLTLLHVIENPKAGDLVIAQDLIESSRRRLASLVPAEVEQWCAPDYCVEHGEAAETILHVAKNRKADLIVMGVHRPAGFPGADTHLSIATAHKVVSQANCPVLTVRSWKAMKDEAGISNAGRE